MIKDKIEQEARQDISGIRYEPDRQDYSSKPAEMGGVIDRIVWYSSRNVIFGEMQKAVSVEPDYD